MRSHSSHKMYLFIIICWCFFYCIPTTATAQKLPPYFEHYDVKNGLSSNSITCMHKDAKGYLWLGTNNGLNKFNGTSFENYRKEENNPASIGGNFIRTIFEDSQGRIWISADNGKLSCLLHPLLTGHEFLNFDLSAHFPSVDGIGINLYLFEDSTSSLFAYSEKGGLFRYHAIQKKFEPVFKNPTAANDLVSGMFLAMDKKSNELYLLNKYDSVFALNTASLQSRPIYNTSLQRFQKTNTNIKKIIQQTGVQENRLWLLSESGLLIAFDVVTGNISSPIKIGGNYRAANNYIRCAGINKEGQICFGINNGGILLYDTLKRKFNELTIPFELPNENRLAEVYTFLLDDKGVFWIGTRSGIYQQSPAMNMFENYTIKQRGLNYNYIININSFCKSGNKLWIPTEDNTMLYDFESNTLAENNLKKDGIKTTAAIFFKDGDGSVYANTRGMQFFDPRSGLIKDINYSGDTVSVNNFKKAQFHTIFRDSIDHNEVWWMSGWGGNGLYLYNVNTKIIKLISLKNGDNIFPPVSLRGIEKDQFGRIWVGSQGNGIIMIDNHYTFSFHIYKNVAGDSNSLPKNIILDLCKARDGSIWIITSGGGIAKMSFTANREPVFKTYSTNANLHHLSLYDALPDNNNNLWISSSAGVEKFSIKNSSFTHYGFNNGIFNPQLATGSYIDDEGYFYLSSWFTFVRFHPDSIRDNLAIPAINISHLQIMNRDSSELLLNDGIQLPFTKNSLSFTLEAINCINAHANKFRYMLVGIDKDWVDASNRNYASYPDIPPGKYTFYFTASNNEGVWNKKPVSFNFSILPPWYQTWWFYSLCMLAFSAIIYALFHYRLQQKLRILQVRNRLHRDLHDDVGATLSSVKAYSEILKDNPNNPVIAQLIKDNSTEMLERLEIIAWATSPEHDNFRSLKNRMTNFAAPLCQAKNIHWAIETSNINEEMMMHGEIRQNIFLVFKEAVNNMIKYAEANACNTSLFIKNNLFVLQITDNGKGFDGTTKGAGNGCNNMQKRTADLNGKLQIESKQGKGTVITMRLPYPFKIPG